MGTKSKRSIIYNLTYIRLAYKGLFIILGIDKFYPSNSKCSYNLYILWIFTKTTSTSKIGMFEVNVSAL